MVDELLQTWQSVQCICDNLWHKIQPCEMFRTCDIQTIWYSDTRSYDIQILWYSNHVIIKQTMWYWDHVILRPCDIDISWYFCLVIFRWCHIQTILCYWDHMILRSNDNRITWYFGHMIFGSCDIQRKRYSNHVKCSDLVVFKPCDIQIQIDI